MLGRSYHTQWRTTEYSVGPRRQRQQHPNLERLICAAISNARFAAELIEAPARALAQWESGQHLTPAERRLVLSITHAQDIYDFAGHLHARLLVQQAADTAAQQLESAPARETQPAQKKLMRATSAALALAQRGGFSRLGQSHRVLATLLETKNNGRACRSMTNAGREVLQWINMFIKPISLSTIARTIARPTQDKASIKQLHRRKTALALAFALAISITASSAGAQAAPNAQLPADIQPMVQLVNQQRAAAGLAPLIEHSVLSTCADQYSEVLAAQGFISHTGPDGSNAGTRLRRCGYNWSHYGENLAAGQQDAAEAVDAWMNSPGHRRILLSPGLREIGVGYTERLNDPARYVEYYVLLFGTQ